MSPPALTLLAAVATTAVLAVPDVTIPAEPIYNTGGNQCYDEHDRPQVRPACRAPDIHLKASACRYHESLSFAVFFNFE